MSGVLQAVHKMDGLMLWPLIRRYVYGGKDQHKGVQRGCTFLLSSTRPAHCDYVCVLLTATVCTVLLWCVISVCDGAQGGMDNYPNWLDGTKLGCLKLLCG